MINLSTVRRCVQISALAAAALGVAACTYLTPYKLEIQQGSVITQEHVSKLKLGMSRSQVSYVLGTPLLTDAFHADRWDYVYYLRKRDRMLDQRRLVLLFDGDALKDIRSDVPAGKDGAPAGAASPAAASPAPTAAGQQQGAPAESPASPPAETPAAQPAPTPPPAAIVTPAPEALDTPTPSTAPAGAPR